MKLQKIAGKSIEFVQETKILSKSLLGIYEELRKALRDKSSQKS